MPRLGIRCLLGSQQLVRSSVAMLEGLQAGLFMGLLSDESFRFYDSYPYDEETTHFLAEAEAGLETWEETFLDAYFRDCQTCLLVAAGGLREMLPLLRRDLEVQAVDYSPRLVRLSNERLQQEGFASQIRLANRYECPRVGHPCEGAIVCRKFYSSILTRCERVQLLRSIRQQLAPQAPLLLSFYSRGRNGLQFQVARAVAVLLRTVTGRRNSIELGDHLDIESPLWHHHFQEAEIRAELEAAGFARERIQFSWFGQALALAADTPDQPQAPLELRAGVA